MALPLRIGVDEHGEDVLIDPVRDAHGIVAGASRSGKTVVGYALLGAIAANRHPVRVIGIDPTGTLLAPYADDPLVVLGQEEPERMVEALQGAVDIHRGRLVAMRERQVDKFNAVGSGGELVLVVIEEYQALLDELSIEDRSRKTADRVRPQVEGLVDALLAGGAKTQVKVILLMQRASAKKIDTDSRANFSTRICMRIDDDESLGLLFPNADRELVRRVQNFGPGYGVVKSPGTDMRLFRADNVAYSEYLGAHR